MEKKTATPQAQATKATGEHEWTDTQINSLFDLIITNPAYERAFFIVPTDDKERSIAIASEQKICFDLLVKTDWMRFMIKEGRVAMNTDGTVRAVNHWPKQMRVVSRLFDKLHPQADTIKSAFGPFKSEDELRWNNVTGFLQWKTWQREGKNTWYFKYVGIKIRLFPRWLTTGPYQFVPRAITSSPKPPQPKTKGKVEGNPSIKAVERPKSALSTSTTSSLSGMEVKDKPTEIPELSKYFTPDNGRQVPPHVTRQKPKLEEKLSEIIASMNDISIEPPLDINMARSISADTNESSGSTSESATATVVEGHFNDKKFNDNDIVTEDTNQDEVISAMLMLMMQELENKNSYCMSDIEIYYKAPPTLSELAILIMIRKMNGKITQIGGSDDLPTTKKELIKGNDDNDKEHSKYILWSSSTQIKAFLFDSPIDKNNLPTPITLAGLVQLIWSNRKVELRPKVLDLITFED